MFSPIADQVLFQKAVEQWALEAQPLFEQHHRVGRRLAIYCAIYASVMLSFWVTGGGKIDLLFTVLGCGATIWHCRNMREHAATAFDLAIMRDIVRQVRARRNSQTLRQIYERYDASAKAEAAHG